MRAFKMGLLFSLAITFLLACNTDHSTNHNANQNSSQAPAATQSPAIEASPSPPPAAVAQPPEASAANANRPAAAATANANKKEEPKPATAQLSKINAAELYKAQMCAGCHGAQGKSSLPGAPDFTDPAWQKKSSDAHLIGAIKKGNPPLMPAYSGKLGDDEIKALVGYIRGFAK